MDSLWAPKFHLRKNDILINIQKVVISSIFKVLFILSIATSIDAMAVGLSMFFLETSIIAPAIIIGIITFFLSFLGVFISKRFGSYFDRIGDLGGIILIVIAITISVENLEKLI